MSLASRERLGQLRVGAAALAATNLVVAFGVLAIGRPTGLDDVAASPGPPATVIEASSPATFLAATAHPLLQATAATIPISPPPLGGGRRAGVADIRRVESTGYCLDGLTASGVPVGPGMVAMNGVPLGSRWRIHDGPFAGTTLEATDRIGHSTEFDIWFARCVDAIDYGRRTITVERIG